MATRSRREASSQHPLIVITGSTGTGKSNLAVAIAKHLTRSTTTHQNASTPTAEIINADAMQMYAGLPIITNKLSSEEQEGIPHHLLGGITLEEDPWSVNRFIKEADRCIEDIIARGRIPIVVGGTGYYIHGLLLFDSTLEAKLAIEDGNTDIVEHDSESTQASPGVEGKRYKEMCRILSGPTVDIYAKLKEVDSEMASRWHPNDRRKIQRSLEIWFRTGRKASEVYSEQASKRKAIVATAAGAVGAGSSRVRLRYDPLIFWLDAEDVTLKERLNRRVDIMLQRGLVREAQEIYAVDKAMQAKGISIDKSKGIWASIGFKEMQPWLDHVENPDVDILSQESIKLQTACIESVKAGTRRYAKRQNRYIRIRLGSALVDAHIDHQFFLLDGSDLSHWKGDVEDQALTMVDTFLQGKKLPAPETLSTLASSTFASMSSNDPTRGRFARHCDACDKVLMTESEWNAHLRSRSHKKVLEGIKRRETLHELSRIGSADNAG